MVIELELYGRIRRLHNEGHSQRHIARILNCSRKIVKKYCQGEILHDAKRSPPSEFALPLPKIQGAIEKELLIMLNENKTLPRKQQRTAKTMWQELTKKGFTVGESTIRRHVRILAQKYPEAFVPFYFEPGEAMQVDWGYCLGLDERCQYRCLTVRHHPTLQLWPLYLSFSGQDQSLFLHGPCQSV